MLLSLAFLIAAFLFIFGISFQEKRRQKRAEKAGQGLKKSD